MNGVPRSERFDDVYFSAEDGLAETRHVFLDGNGLPEFWAGRENFTICETGFGTGLNMLATLKLWLDCNKTPKNIHYISYEKYPLSRHYIREHLSRWPELSFVFDAMDAYYPDDLDIPFMDFHLFDRFHVTIMVGDINALIPYLPYVPHVYEADAIDCWYLDGFTPAKNPDMWSDTVFQAMGKNSRKGARFATFTAAGFVKRGLMNAGFDVQKAKGFGRKRDMLVGHYMGGDDAG